MSTRYSPWREDPQTHAQLLAWLMVRLPRGVESIGSRFAVRWRFVDLHEAEWTMRGAIGATMRHLPEIADAFAAHADRIELAECEAEQAARSARW